MPQVFVFINKDSNNFNEEIGQMKKKLEQCFNITKLILAYYYHCCSVVWFSS